MTLSDIGYIEIDEIYDGAREWWHCYPPSSGSGCLNVFEKIGIAKTLTETWCASFVSACTPFADCILETIEKEN